MADQQDSLQSLFDRAAADPDLIQQLAADPIGTAREAAVEISVQDLKHLLNMPDASDEEVVEALKARVSHTGLHGVGGCCCCCC